MAQRKNNLPKHIGTFTAVVNALAELGSNDKVQAIAEKLLHQGGQAAQKIAAAAKTADPFDDLEAKIAAISETLDSDQAQLLSEAERSEAQAACQRLSRGIEMAKVVHGRERKKKIKELRKAIDLHFDALFTRIIQVTEEA